MNNKTVTRREFLTTLAPAMSPPDRPEKETSEIDNRQEEFVPLFNDGQTLQG